MKQGRLMVGIALLLATTACGTTQVQRLTDMHERSIATPEGKEYEAVAVQTFWSDPSFMRECAPPNGSVEKPLTLYFEVTPDGRMGELLIAPNTAAAECIRQHVINRQFPKPPGTFVAIINLKFAA